MRRGPHRTPPPPGPDPSGLAAAREGHDPSAPGAARKGCAPLSPCPDRTSFFTFHSSFSLTASSALPMVGQVAGKLLEAGPRPRAPARALAASAPPDSAPHARGGAPSRSTPRLPPPQPLPGAQLRSHLPSPADVRQQARPLPTAGREGVCAPRLGGGCVCQGGWGAWGRRALARAAGMVVMVTGGLLPRGREPAL